MNRGFYVACSADNKKRPARIASDRPLSNIKGNNEVAFVNAVCLAGQTDVFPFMANGQVAVADFDGIGIDFTDNRFP